MKKIFTLIVALIGLAGVANAATVDDIQPLKHSYVFVADDYTNNGVGTRTKGDLFGDDHFLDVTGGSVATNKGSFDLSVADEYGVVTEDIVKKYGTDYAGSHLNSLRLKNAQDVIAFKATAGSKIIIFYQNNSKDRYPYFAKDAALTKPYDTQGTKYIAYDKEGVDKAHSPLARIEWTVPADGDGVTTYVGSKGGDMFVSFIIVEANEAPGTPIIKVGPQTYENGLYFKTVTITPQEDDGAATVVQYTTDGTTPTASNGTLYTGPFNVYNNATVKAVPFYGEVGEGLEVPGSDGTGTADTEIGVNFKFNAPTIEDDGNGNVTITSEYANSKNFASYLDKTDVEGSNFTLTESANVSAYSEITNGSYGTFESAKTSKDVYVLSPVSNATLNFGKAAIEVDAEKTTEQGVVYKFSDPYAIAPKAQFYFNAAPQVKIVSDAQYQIDGDSIYLGMANANNLTFKVAEGDSVDVTVVTSKNSCKNIADTTLDEKSNTYKNLANFVNVDGTNYGFDNTPENFQNVITFRLGEGIHTFRKYSGTGNIIVHSIAIKEASAPVTASTVYDFAAAAGETIDWNLNPSKTAAPFRINKKAGAEDRQERNFRGYQNYTGTILPAICNVYFVRPIVQDTVNAGLKFANESNLAIDSLTNNSVITIEYTNTDDNKLIYAPGNKLQTEATVNGAVAESGVTEIPSGTAVTITKAATGGNEGKEKNAAYTCFRIPKNTTITKITVVEGNGETEVATGIKNINAAENANAIQKPVKVIENGRLVIKTANGTFAIDGARLK